jgi:N-acetylneuraminic acid mutarotase
VWTQKANYPQTVSTALGFSIGCLGYIGSGWTPYLSKEFWSYNPITNKWSRIADYPINNFLPSVALSIKDDGYVGLGMSYGPNKLSKEFWKYNVSKDTWIKMKDFGGIARNLVSGFEINGKGYVGLGWNEVTCLKDMWEYNPDSNQWKQIAQFPGKARSQATGFSINGKGYIFGGYTDDGATFLNDLWEYDPQKNQWTQKTSLPSDERMRTSAFVIDKKGYLGCGTNGPKRFNDIWQYDPITDSWIEVENLSNIGRQLAVAFSINNRGYVGTGSNIGVPYYNDFWEYRLSSDTGQCFQSPKANFIENIFCENDSVEFINNSNCSKSYIWNFDDGHNSNLKSPKHLFNIGGVSKEFNVKLVVLDSNGCSDSIIRSVKINANPNSDFNFQVNQNVVDFQATSIDVKSYKWIFGNGDTSTAKDVKYKYTQSGNYTVCLSVTDESNCTSKTCKDISATLGISNINNQINFSIFPNPNSGNFTIKMQQDNELITVEIFNQIGQIVSISQLNELSNNFNINLVNGVYSIRIKKGLNYYNCKMVVIN